MPLICMSERNAMNKMQKALHELAEMDELAARSSPIHALHPAAKLIATIAYILVTLSFNKYDLGGLFPMLLWPILLFQLSGIEVRSSKFPEIPVSLERNTEVFRHPLL